MKVLIIDSSFNGLKLYICSDQSKVEYDGVPLWLIRNVQYLEHQMYTSYIQLLFW